MSNVSLGRSNANRVKQLMGWALWYYGGKDFPVLQAVYPDLENRFPEEEGFDIRFERPLMQPDVHMRNVEADLSGPPPIPKAACSTGSFPDTPHTRVYLSETVHKGTESVTYVSHDAEDGAWQFLGDSMDGGGGPVISCFHHPIDNDPTLSELANLPLGWCATRSKPGEAWIRREQQDPEENSRLSSTLPIRT